MGLGYETEHPFDDDDDAAFAEDEKARIAALHKSAPEVIWLQVDPEAEQFDGWEAQTWCSDKINETDVEYVRADTVARLREVLQEAIDGMGGSYAIWSPKARAALMPNVEFSGGAPLHGASSAGTQG